MTSKRGWLGSVLLQKGGQIDVRAEPNGGVQLAIRNSASAEQMAVLIVPSEVDQLIKVLQEARA
jgi:hypothetical protein